MGSLTLAGALQRALDGLARRLGARDIKAHIYVVGGAAMVLAHRSERFTRDVDALAIDRRGGRGAGGAGS